MGERRPEARVQLLFATLSIAISGTGNFKKSEPKPVSIVSLSTEWAWPQPLMTTTDTRTCLSPATLLAHSSTTTGTEFLWRGQRRLKCGIPASGDAPPYGWPRYE